MVTGWFYYISLDSCKVWKHLKTLYQYCIMALSLSHRRYKAKEVCNEMKILDLDNEINVVIQLFKML